MIIAQVKVLFFMLIRIPGQLFRDVFVRSGSQTYLRSNYLEWSRFSLRLYGVKLEVRGKENIPDSRPLLVLANHQSFLDIPALVEALETPLGFVAKRELGSFPIVNLWMRRIGCVFIDRRNRLAAQKSLEQAGREIGEHPMVLFPEGTRSRSGELLPIKLGGLRLAILSKAKVLPVFLDGTRAALEERKKGTTVFPARLVVFPPMDTAALPDTKESLLKIRDYLDSCWQSANSSS